MRMVGPQPDQVESQLAAGELRCPGCDGELRPWSFARPRRARGPLGLEALRPRRSRCRGCRGTHVLLPVRVLLRRLDLVEVIGRALLAKASGEGHRRIAAALRVPEETVRSWLRRFTQRAAAIREQFTRLAHELGPDLRALQPRGSPLQDALEAIGVAARVTADRFGEGSVWHFVAGVTGGRLLSNTS